MAALLIALVGGRVTPSFTRNWMVRAKLSPLPAPMDHLDSVALAITVIALVGWLVAPDAPAVGGGLLAAGLLLIARLARWRGYRTAREPMVLVLHVGYLWLAVALVLLGLSALSPSTVPASSAIHALTAGAVGTMTLAIMTRASRGHTGRAVSADILTTAIYVLVTFGALCRVSAPLLDPIYEPVLIVGGVSWAAAFILFVLGYGPMLATRRLS